MLLDNIYIINLDKSKDRLIKLKKNFDKYNIHFTRFPAIYGKNLSNTDIDNNVTHLCKTLLCNHAIVGCAMSHIHLWKQLEKDNDAYAYIILEDDAEIDSNFKNIINEIEKSHVFLNFDIISLHCISQINCSQYKTSHILPSGTIIGKPIFPLTTTGYIISKKGASKLLKLLNNNINYHIDFQIAQNIISNNIDYYSINKNIIKSTTDDSTIGPGDKFNSITLYSLKLMGLNSIAWYLNVPVITIAMKYPINLYIILLIVLLFINLLYVKNNYITICIIIELIIYLMYLFMI